jgi:ATP-dependent DNA helicase RecQ
VALDPLPILRRTFGFPSFRGRQAEVVAHLLGGGSCLVLMPTGGGKSLCFQVPALCLDGVALVVSPLIALMQDQVDALRLLGVPAAFYNSSLTPEEKQTVRADAAGGRLKLLYVAPETLNTAPFLALVDRLRVSLLAVDEAHCVSQWGHDFRPDYLEVARLRERLPAAPLVALTATADPLTRKEILHRLGLADAPVFASSFDRPNLRYEIGLKDSGREQLLAFLRARHAGDAGIVYCLSRKKVDESAAWLSSKGVRALPYHAGLDAAVRREHQARFQREEGLVICATIAFGMGIDKPDVRFVAHLDLPKSVEGYYQETGRAGRDGLPASAWMVYGLGDVVQLRQLLAGGEGTDEFKRLQQQKLTQMLGLCEGTACRRQMLLSYFGEEHPGGCGSCDNCLDGARTWDGTVAAQKALSAIARTGGRFGAGHLIDVLLGQESEKTARNGHERLTVWGIGKELGERQWSSVYRQLAAGGFLEVDAEGFGALSLNDRSWQVLRKQLEVRLREDPAPAVRSKPGRSATDRPMGPGGGGAPRSSRAGEAGDELSTRVFEALRGLRTLLAEEQKVPAYVVFHNSTLEELAASRPSTLDALAQVKGVGEAKLERYGARVLETIAAAATGASADPAGAEGGEPTDPGGR